MAHSRQNQDIKDISLNPSPYKHNQTSVGAAAKLVSHMPPANNCPPQPVLDQRGNFNLASGFRRGFQIDCPFFKVVRVVHAERSH